MVTYKQLLEDVGGFIVAKGLEEDYIKFMNDKKILEKADKYGVGALADM